MACVSLYSMTYYLDPLLALASGEASKLSDNLLTKALSGTLSGDSDAMQETLAKVMGEQGGEGVNLQTIDIQSLLAGNGDLSSLTANATPEKQSNASKNIVMQDVRNAGLDENTIEKIKKSGVALHKSGKLDEAINAYQREIQEQPTQRRGGTYLNLSIAYYQIEQYDKAWDCVYLARKHNKEPREGYLTQLEAKMPDPGS